MCSPKDRLLHCWTSMFKYVNGLVGSINFMAMTVSVSDSMGCTRLLPPITMIVLFNNSH